MHPLTKRQEEVLEYIKQQTLRNGYAPTVREIAEGVKLNSGSTAHAHVQQLVSKGYVKKIKGSPRALQVVKVGE
ncbi:LexA repressor [Halalkalibacillus sediminis]|uniref:LexA repressor n=1 Tax=Halalkalibacillus sediminis TaxID=2018042 RepID=A0A2I0QXZ3_9BACI|nr:LexA repressor [Halalkalibacillus sediminis]PKR79202.1 LexA repressor [Halalkalibacillus sediminis]